MPRKRRTSPTWSHEQPDLRETIRRLSRWQDDERSDLISRVRKINAAYTPRKLKQR